MCKKGWCVRLGQEQGSLHKGGGNCLKYLKWGQKRKRGVEKKIRKGGGAVSIKLSLALLSSYANQSSGSGTFLTATESLSVSVLIKLRSIRISQGKSLFIELG